MHPIDFYSSRSFVLIQFSDINTLADPQTTTASRRRVGYSDTTIIIYAKLVYEEVHWGSS